MNFIDLFSGTGGFSHVLENNGYKCLFANDMISESKTIHDLNLYSGVFRIDDIHDIDTLDIPPHDILCGGFPCQPFSIAGKKQGFKDSRSNVFWKIIDILNVHSPRIVILENVKNLLTHDNGNTFDTIKKSLEEVGYQIHYKILDTCKITSLPQHRERIYIVGFLKTQEYENFNMNFDNIQTNDISEYLEKKVQDKYYYTEKLKVYDEIKKSVTNHISTNTVYQYRRHYVRENKSGVCPTLTANMGGGGHNVPIIKDDNGIRKLTPRECFNIQGFPQDYKLPNISDSKLYKLAGNAISIPVLDLIIKRIKSIEKNE